MSLAQLERSRSDFTIRDHFLEFIGGVGGAWTKAGIGLTAWSSAALLAHHLSPLSSLLKKGH